MKVTKQDAIDALREFYDREGCSPSGYTWRNRGLRPSQQTIYRCFGGLAWGAILEAADLPPASDRRPRKDEQTREAMARLESGEKLSALAREYGVGKATLSGRIGKYCKRTGVSRPPLHAGSLSFEEREAAQLADDSRRIT